MARLPARPSHFGAAGSLSVIRCCLPMGIAQLGSRNPEQLGLWPGWLAV
ncbi:hypothetical protein [Paracoccus sp. (in: a-proteobacteria)]|nr:hypothetical protein [Paracoccus sp. (in: a-proteobacteria)]